MASLPLAVLARNCQALLKQQRVHVQNAREARQRASRPYLSLAGAETALESHINTLQKWEEKVGDATDSNETRRSEAAVRAADVARQSLGQINKYVADIGNTINSGRDVSTFTKEEENAIRDELEDKLGLVNKYMELLEGSSISLGSDETREQERQVQKVRKDFTGLKTYFVNKIRHLSVEDRKATFSIRLRKFKVRFETLLWFWEKLPKLSAHGVEKGKAWPGHLDGYIIPENLVEQARTVLALFKEAWYEANNTDATRPMDQDKLNKIDKVSKIAMVLDLTDRRRLLNFFLEGEIDDEDMDSSPYRDELGEEAKFIAAQYSRTLPTEWPNEGTLELGDHKVLPLRRIESVCDKVGGFSRVSKVEDLRKESREVKIYACKEMTPEPGAEEHILTEIRSLQDICNEDHGHHLVKYVRSYNRPGNPDTIWGVLLEPYADKNLNDLLREYCAQPTERLNNKNRKSLLHAFGCLAYSLCYLHNIKSYRHRDIKPQNILYVNSTREFLWSDFGLAYSFNDKVNSKTYTSGFTATHQYEAPEIHNANAKEIEHGRSADVFSLGCVFLEIISVLLLPKNANVDKIPFQRFYDYKDNIDKIEIWIERNRQEAKTNNQRLLDDLLRISLHMIDLDARRRWKIGAVTKALASIRHPDERNPIPFCRQCAAKFEEDSSRHPRHPNILKHERRSPIAGFMEKLHISSPTSRRPR